MSSIKKETCGTYRARYRDINGRTRSKNFDHLDEARDFLARMGGDLVRGEFVDPARARELFDSWADRWWRSTVRLRPSTRYGYRCILDNHVVPYFSGRKIGSVDFATVEDFIAALYDKGLSPKMVRQAVSIVSLIFKAAVKSRALSHNPGSGHEIKLRRKKLREGDVLDMVQLHQLVAHTSERYRPAVWLLALAGLRPAELCGLRVRDVDFVRRTVTIRQTLMPLHKFDDEATRLLEGPPKTDAGDRCIPIPAWLCDELATMLAAREDRERDGWLFRNAHGRPLNRDLFRADVIRPALRAAGLPETIRTYDLRHSHASLLIELGANPLAVAARMGHSNPNVTLSVYGHLFEGAQAKLTEQLDALREATANAPEKGALINLDARREMTQS